MCIRLALLLSVYHGKTRLVHDTVSHVGCYDNGNRSNKVYENDMKILAIYDSSGPKYHRVLLSCHGLEQYGYEIKVIRQVFESDLVDTDIVFFNRMIAGMDIKILITYKERYGFRLVCDLDDAWILGKDHVLYLNYEKYGISEKIASYIKASDIITVTHERLYKEVLPLNKNVHILPNAIPKVDQFLIEKIPCELTRLFWAGGITHRKDLELLRRPLQLIKRDKVKLVIAGYVHGEEEWRQMAKIYTTDSAYNTEVFESLPVQQYYKAYAHCDISLIPLLKTEFNANKSNLKILEAANIGAPVVVSRVHPYIGFPDHLVNYVDGVAPWYYQITKLLKDPELVRAQGFGLQAYCDRVYNFEKITEHRKQIFEYAKTDIYSKVSQE